MKEKIYSDVILDMEVEEKKVKITSGMLKVSDKYLKEVRKSIGWVEPEFFPKWWQFWKQERWDVYLGEGSYFTTNDHGEAEMLSQLVQLNARLKRMEAR